MPRLPDALTRAHTRLLAELAEALPEADSATMERARHAAERHLTDAGDGSLRTILDAVRAGVAAAGCP